MAVLFAGDDRAEDHHDVEVQDESGRVLGRARLPEGVAGVARFHELIGRFADPGAGPGQVAVGIETDRGPRVVRGVCGQPAAGGSVGARRPVLNEQAAVMEAQVESHFGQHPDAEIFLSQPGLGNVLSAQVLAGSGDDPDRYADARNRKNYAGTSPITRVKLRVRAGFGVTPAAAR